MEIQRGLGKNIDDVVPIEIGNYHFLGIGINKYIHWKPLANAVNDIVAISSLLREQYHFDSENISLIQNENATRKNIVNTLHYYTDKAKFINDSLIIYFSGHGYLDKNKDGYWVPYDSFPNDIDSYLPNLIIHNIISKLSFRHVLLISDSCFSGSFIRTERDVSTEVLIAQELEQKKSRWIITSGGKDQTVSDGFNNNSPFAEALISELTHNQKPKLIADELALRVRTITRGNADQLPQFEKLFGTGDLGGRFIFNKKTRQATIIEQPVAKNNTLEYTEEEKVKQKTALQQIEGTKLIQSFASQLSSYPFEIALTNIAPLLHRTLLQNGQIKSDIKNGSLKTAYEKIHLYHQPIVIKNANPTGRTFIGSLSTKEEGEEWIFSISRKNDAAGLPAYIRIFFPKNNSTPSIVGISL